MKYNTFWGHIFWLLLVGSLAADAAPVVQNMWDLIYYATIRDSNPFLWLLLMFYMVFLLLFKTILLVDVFPRKNKSVNTKDILQCCAIISALLAFIVLIAVVVNGGLHVYSFWRGLQSLSYMFTPFILIYYLVREEER